MPVKVVVVVTKTNEKLAYYGKMDLHIENQDGTISFNFMSQIENHSNMFQADWPTTLAQTSDAKKPPNSNGKATSTIQMNASSIQ